MTNRRQFLAGAAASGLAFCSCGLLDQARAATAGLRTPVKVDGKPVRTIDIHAHCLFHDAANLMGDQTAGLTPNINGAKEVYLVVEDRLKAMDAQHVDMEVLSVNPFWYGTARDVGERIVTIQNEQLAQLCASNPRRFKGFASLTLQAPDLAVRQLEIAMKQQGMVGAAIGDRVGADEFSDPKFHPVWAKAEELGAALFIHPQGVPELNKRLAGNGWLANTIANPLGTTIALQHLIFEGTLDRFPKLKVIGAHGGGYLPSYAPRDDHACFVAPAFCNPAVGLKKKPTEYLSQLYFDALVFTPEAVRHLVAQVGASQIMMGSDYPYPWELHPVDAIMACNSLTPQQKVAVLAGNAARVLGIKA
jgi:aminocarboxymuconate-semialdehyde decarboxylase